MIKPEDGVYRFLDEDGAWQELPVEIMELLAAKYGLKTVLHDENGEQKAKFA